MTTRDATGLALILIVVALLGVFTWHQQHERGDAEQENLAFLRSLRVDAIAGVSISDEHGRPFKTITAGPALATFASAINATEPYRPNHPYVTSKFQVALRPKDGPMHRFDLYTVFPADSTIYMDFYRGGTARVSNCTIG